MSETAIEAAMEAFLCSDDFEHALYASTFLNGGQVLEVFNDGTYRVLPTSSIGNLYVSEGLMIDIPSLGECEYDDEEDEYDYEAARWSMIHFEISEGEVQRHLREALAEALRTGEAQS